MLMLTFRRLRSSSRARSREGSESARQRVYVRLAKKKEYWLTVPICADQVALSILFVGYVLMQVPSNMLLNFSGKPSWYIGFWVIAWGLVSACTSQVSTFGDIVACRFILGFVEAPFFCGVIFYLSKWYTREELSFRMAIFYSASLLSGAFGNLIAAGILSGLDGARGLAPWQVSRSTLQQSVIAHRLTCDY